MFLLLHISTSNQLHFKVGSETGSAFHFLPARAWRWGKGGGRKRGIEGAQPTCKLVIAQLHYN